MTAPTIKLGDTVAHDGTWPGHEDEHGPYRVVMIRPTGVVFENRRYKVACVLAELIWDAAFAAWRLPGRLFSVEQRRSLRRVLGLPDNGELAEDRAILAQLTPAQLLVVDRRADEEFRARDNRVRV